MRSASIIFPYLFISWCNLVSAPDTSNIAIRRLSVNSEKSDFSPVYNNGKLYFVSSRYHGTGVMHEQYNASTTDIFFSEKSDTSNFKSVTAMGASINTRWNEGPFTLSSDGKEIFFTAGIKGQKLAIYSSRLIDGKWSVPVIAKFCDPEFNFCHPSLSENSKRIYFSSDVNGGYGGMDIFYCDLENGHWSTPVNAGKNINSSQNDLFPFICGENELYFSSDRGVLGGLDIYKYSFSKSDLSLLPSPINSASDDFGAWIDRSGEFGYFSSNRNKKYSDDIYSFTKKFPDLEELKPLPVKNSWCYTFYEETSLLNEDTVNLTFEWDFGDGSKARSLIAKHCYNATGEYIVQLNVIEKVSGEIFRSEVSFPLTVKNQAKAGIISSDTLPAGKPLELAAFFDMQSHDILSYYWKIGDRNFFTGEKVRHVFKHKGNYRVILAVVTRNKSTGNKEKFKIEKLLWVRDKDYALK